MNGSKVLRISEAGSLALHTVVYLAAKPDRPVPAREMAGALSVSEAHLAKVMQRLVRHGLTTSTRGPKGGFRLSRPAGEVMLLDAYEAIEGPMVLSGCLFGNSRSCNGPCILGDLVDNVNEQVKDYLATTSAADMVTVFGGKKQ